MCCMTRSYCGPDIAVWVVDGDDVEIVSVQHSSDVIIDTISGYPLKQIIELQLNRFLIVLISSNDLLHVVIENDCLQPYCLINTTLSVTRFVHM